MMKSWRRAFCTSIPKDTNDEDTQHLHHNKPTSRFTFFSSTPSTPRSDTISKLRCRTSTTPSPSLPTIPNLKCKTTPVSSPASFSTLKSKLRFNKKCGICSLTVKPGQGTAIYTAECSHTFHYPCVISQEHNNRFVSCPVCKSLIFPKPDSQTGLREVRTKLLRVDNDDEPLISSPISPAGFHTILESDEDDETEFNGFSVNTPLSLTATVNNNINNTPLSLTATVNNNKNAPLSLTADSVSRNIDVKLLSEAAVVGTGKGYETFSVVMKVKASQFPTVRSPVDLVTVLDVSGREKLESLKRTMRVVINNLKENDRLSIVAFSSSSKRLLSLRRMTTSGKRAARRVVDIVTVSGGGVGEGMSVNDAVKKGVKVLEDRREKNPFATVFVLTDQAHQAHFKIPVRTIWLGVSEEVVERSINGYLSLSVQDLGLELGLVSGSGHGEISAVYSLSGRPGWVGTGSVWLGDMYAEEERVYLVEIKIKTPVCSSSRSHRVMTVRCRYVDPTTQEVRNPQDLAIFIPWLLTVRSSSNPNIARLRNLHVSTRAVAESRRLIERNNYTGAQRLLTSARALLVQYGMSSSDTCLRGLDAELAGLSRGHVALLESPEVLTPTSAWKAAEKLAKVAMVRKHMNRVSDLHGFEDARF